jgi:acetyl esterase/lipase
MLSLRVLLAFASLVFAVDRWLWAGASVSRPLRQLSLYALLPSPCHRQCWSLVTNQLELYVLQRRDDGTQLTVHWITPAGHEKSGTVLLFLHGGGYIGGYLALVLCILSLAERTLPLARALVQVAGFAPSSCCAVGTQS